jgi:hypothetical protein
MWFGKPNIDRLKRKTDVSGLVKALRNKDWRIRDSAIDALGVVERGVYALEASGRSRLPRCYTEAGKI